MKKTRNGKLTLHRETLRTLTTDDLAAAVGRAAFTLTCPESGCYICTGLGCTMTCPPTIIE